MKWSISLRASSKMSGSSSGSVRFRDSSWPFGLRLLAVPPPVPPGSAEFHLCFLGYRGGLGS